MTVKHTFYRATPKSPFAVRLKEIIKEQTKNSKVLLDFVEEIGATQVFGNNPENYMFDFPKGQCDPKVWKKHKLPRNSYSMVPRKHTPEGQAMLARMRELPSMPEVDEALNVIPGMSKNRAVFHDMSVYYPFTRYYHLKKNIFIISIPSGGMEKQKAWVVPKWLKEMKEWEVLKLIEEAA